MELRTENSVVELWNWKFCTGYVCIRIFCIDFMVNIVFDGLKGISKIVF